MQMPDINAKLRQVVITDLLPRQRLVELWAEFKRDKPDEFERMRAYDGTDPDWVQTMQGWVKLYIILKLMRGELPVKPGMEVAFQANAIGVSVIQLGRIIDPELRWLGWD